MEKPTEKPTNLKEYIRTKYQLTEEELAKIDFNISESSAKADLVNEAVKTFLDNNPTYFPCEENYEKISTYVTSHELSPMSAASYQVAFDSLQGKLVGPIKEPVGAKPIIKLPEYLNINVLAEKEAEKLPAHMKAALVAKLMEQMGVKVSTSTAGMESPLAELVQQVKVMQKELIQTSLEEQKVFMAKTEGLDGPKFIKPVKLAKPEDLEEGAEIVDVNPGRRFKEME